MAEGQGVSSLPLPPMQYVNLYTDENIKRGRAPKPPPPIKDNFTMFGAQFSADDVIIRPLESNRIRRLYPQNHDPKRELKKLNHSILINFLDLLDILIKSLESPKRAEKIEDLTLLFIHMHHLVNEFRPHQARETLRVMMEVQKRQRLETAERFQKKLEKVQELIQGAITALPEEAALDTKLVIKTEPMELSPESIPTPQAAQALPMDMKTDEEMVNGHHDEEEGDVNDLDALMCDIIDTM